MKNKLKHIIDWNLFAKYLSNESSNEESKKVVTWINDSKENKKYYEKIKKIWALSTSQKDIEKINEEESLKRVLNKADQIKKSKKKQLVSNISRIAAVFLIIVCISLIVNYYTSNKLIFNKDLLVVTTGITEKTKITLPDSSFIFINSNTSLSYPDEFSKSNRIVHLKGEAFFEVKSDINQPFVVYTNDIKIKVIGTSFDVKAYQKDEEVEVIVKTGKVLVSDRKKKLFKDELLLKTGTKGSFSKSSKILIKTKNSDGNYLAWKTGKLVFDKTGLAEVIKSLEQMYSVKIEIRDEHINELELTGTFENQSLDSILEILMLTLDINVKRDNNLIVIVANDSINYTP